MNNIKFIKLNQVCFKITDGSHYSPKGIEFGFPMLSVKDMLENGFSYQSCKYISNEDYLDLVKADCKPLVNDILIAKDGSYLKHVFVIKKDVNQAILSSIGILRPNLEKVYPEYIKYYLQTNSVKETVSRKYVSGSALPRIILKNFGEIQIINKNLTTQKQIAKVLSDLDAKIEINNKINQELEAMAKTLYDFWFVQFDFPYDFAQNKPDINGQPYKSSGGKMVYNEELKREIPEGWEVEKLKNIAQTGSGSTPLKSKKEYYENGNIPWINSGEVNAPFIISAKKYISQLGLDKSSAKLFKRGTILMAMYGATAGQVSLIDIEASTNQAICGINLKDEKLKYYTKLSLEDMYQYLVNLSTGSARDNLSQDKIKDLKIVMPDKILITEFHNKVKSNFDLILKNLKQNQKLVELRDWLLPMLMNGQVTIKEAEEQIRIAAEPRASYG